MQPTFLLHNEMIFWEKGRGGPVSTTFSLVHQPLLQTTLTSIWTESPVTFLAKKFILELSNSGIWQQHFTFLHLVQKIV